MRRRNIFITIAFSSCLFFNACDNDKDENNAANTQDLTFIIQTSMSNNAEIQLGKMALENSTDGGVKKYAQQMVTDHTTAQNDLKTIAVNVGVTVSDTAIGSTYHTMMQRLLGLTGKSFDSTYINDQRKSHQLVITNSQTEINSGMNQQVKGYASTKLPTIQMHLNMADTIFARIK